MSKDVIREAFSTWWKKITRPTPGFFLPTRSDEEWARIGWNQGQQHLVAMLESPEMVEAVAQAAYQDVCDAFIDMAHAPAYHKEEYEHDARVVLAVIKQKLEAA